MKKAKRLLAVLLVFVMAFALAACGTKKEESNEAKQEETKKEESKKLEGTLKVIATSENYQPLFDKFTEEVGPKVEFISMSSGEVLSKLKAEGGTPAADLWFGGGIDAFMDAKANNLLEKVDFDAAKDLTADYKDSENYWFSKGITVVGFIVNNDILKEKGLEQLGDIKYKTKWYPNGATTQAMYLTVMHRPEDNGLDLSLIHI